MSNRNHSYLQKAAPEAFVPAFKSIPLVAKPKHNITLWSLEDNTWFN